MAFEWEYTNHELGRINRFNIGDDGSVRIQQWIKDSKQQMLHREVVLNTDEVAQMLEAARRAGW